MVMPRLRGRQPHDTSELAKRAPTDEMTKVASEKTNHSRR